MANPSPAPSAQLFNFPNMGAIIKIETNLAYLTTLSFPNVKNQVSIENPNSWVEMELTPETASFVESCKPVSQGLIYNSLAEWQSPNVNQDNFQKANQFIGKGVVVKFTTSTGIKFIVGERGNWASIFLVKTVPKEVAGFNGYKFTIKYPNSHPVYFVA